MLAKLRPTASDECAMCKACKWCSDLFLCNRWSCPKLRELYSCVPVRNINLEIGIKPSSISCFTLTQTYTPSMSPKHLDKTWCHRVIISGGQKVQLIYLLILIRSSNCIDRYNGLLSSSNVFMGRLYLSILSSDSSIDQPFFEFKVLFFYRMIVSFHFQFRIFNHPIRFQLYVPFFSIIGQLCWSISRSYFYH